jgi:hypothetical protein
MDSITDTALFCVCRCYPNLLPWVFQWLSSHETPEWYSKKQIASFKTRYSKTQELMTKRIRLEWAILGILHRTISRTKHLPSQTYHLSLKSLFRTFLILVKGLDFANNSYIMNLCAFSSGGFIGGREGFIGLGYNVVNALSSSNQT